MKDFPWENYREYAALYYDALYDFNVAESNKTVRDAGENPETKEQARQRLLFDRATMQDSQQDLPPKILYQDNVVELKAPKVNPMDLAPGDVPSRLVGRKPKCFFSLLKSFIGTTLIGYPAEPEQVH